MIGRTKIILSLQDGTEKHISESMTLEDSTLTIDSNVLRTLGSGSGCDVDFGDLSSAKIVFLLGDKEFKATFNGSSDVRGSTLLFWGSEVTSIHLEDISGDGTEIRVIISG